MEAAGNLPLGRRRLWPFAVAIPAASLLILLIWPPLLARIGDSGFILHRYCYLNTPSLVWINVVTDFLIGSAYVAISATLAYLVHRARRDIPFSWMFLAFGLFIVACGGTHYAEVITTVVRPIYWFATDLKIATAAASVVTAALLPALVPKTLALLVAARLSEERRKQLESANVRLREMEEISTSVVERGAGHIAAWDWDLRTGKVHWSVDPAAVFGRSAEELRVIDQVFEYIHADDRHIVREAVDRAFREHTMYDADFRIMMADGSERWVIGRGRPYYDADGSPVSLVGINLDVTSRKQSEMALMRSEKLTVAGRLAASIAHEINNPLASVTNLLYLISAESGSDTNVGKFTALAQEELNRVAHIVRQTLGFYREETSFALVSPAQIMRSALELHSAALKKKNIRVVEALDSDRTVYALGGELRQVFANLVINAIEATPPGGALLVRVCNAQSYKDGSAGVRITIADTGHGISKANRARIFEPFFTTKGERGTGLGLWVSANIVQKHGGSIRVRSNTRGPKTGTVFSIFLPADRPAELPRKNKRQA